MIVVDTSLTRISHHSGLLKAELVSLNEGSILDPLWALLGVKLWVRGYQISRLPGGDDYEELSVDEIFHALRIVVRTEQAGQRRGLWGRFYASLRRNLWIPVAKGIS